MAEIPLPPPPPPLPLPSFGNNSCNSGLKNRSEFLADIRKGAVLKKTPAFECTDNVCSI